MNHYEWKFEFVEHSTQHEDQFLTLSLLFITIASFLTATGQEESRRVELRKRLENYINRAEFIKKHIEKEQEEGKYHEKIEIEDNATGFSYQTVFCRFLDEHVTSVYIEDPYIRSVHQVAPSFSFLFSTHLNPLTSLLLK